MTRRIFWPCACPNGAGERKLPVLAPGIGAWCAMRRPMSEAGDLQD